MFIGESNPESYSSNYGQEERVRNPRDNYRLVVDDSEFTDDEIDHLLRFKKRLADREELNKKVFNGLLMVGANVCGYAVLRYMILTSGGGALGAVIFGSFLINGITQGKIWQDAKISYREGQIEVNGVMYLVRGLLGVAASIGVIFLVANDYFTFNHRGQLTYKYNVELYESYKRVPEPYKPDANLALGGMIGGAVVIASAAIISKRGI